MGCLTPLTPNKAQMKQSTEMQNKLSSKQSRQKEKDKENKQKSKSKDNNNWRQKQKQKQRDRDKEKQSKQKLVLNFPHLKNNHNNRNSQGLNGNQYVELDFGQADNDHDNNDNDNLQTSLHPTRVNLQSDRINYQQNPQSMSSRSMSASKPLSTKKISLSLNSHPDLVTTANLNVSFKSSHKYKKLPLPQSLKQLQKHQNQLFQQIGNKIKEVYPGGMSPLFVELCQVKINNCRGSYKLLNEEVGRSYQGNTFINGGSSKNIIESSTSISNNKPNNNSNNGNSNEKPKQSTATTDRNQETTAPLPLTTKLKQYKKSAYDVLWVADCLKIKNQNWKEMKIRIDCLGLV